MIDPINRRDFLHLTALSSLTYLAGCAANPVTGRSQLMLVSEDQEIQIDRKNSPYQLSSDYGNLQDPALNRYLNTVGGSLAHLSHRPNLPYRFHCVNATYVNAYAFPGGTIAATRGILLELENEAELAALFGHELGHVNARHTAQQMSKGTLVQGLVGGLSIFAESMLSGSGKVSSMLGSLGAGALLASYSRDNEREADSLAMEYMVRAGYNPKGSIALMTMLTKLSKHNPNALELMFSTHPMSKERLESAKQLAATRYPQAARNPLFRDRYMDHTAALRAKKTSIALIQKGEEALAQKKYTEAENLFNKALKESNRDYAGLAGMAKCMLLQKKNAEAQRFASRAKEAYPGEPQARLISGVALLKLNRYERAIADFNGYDAKLPGNPNILFFKGVAFEKRGRKDDAAQHYYAYLKQVRQGEQAQYAHQRLVEWKYIKEPAK